MTKTSIPLKEPFGPIEILRINDVVRYRIPRQRDTNPQSGWGVVVRLPSHDEGFINLAKADGVTCIFQQEIMEIVPTSQLRSRDLVKFINERGVTMTLPFRELNKETLSAVMLGGSTYPLWDVRGMQEPDAGYDRRGWVNGTRKISLNDLMARLDKYITAGCAHERSIDNSGFSADTRDSLEKARLSASENFKHGLRLILMNGLTEEDKEVINDD
ncbi:hypothetical protein [Burkholderia phage BCSR5]|nr:hypothetical protein [Burkholderia phage BCSR5]